MNVNKTIYTWDIHKSNYGPHYQEEFDHIYQIGKEERKKMYDQVQIDIFKQQLLSEFTHDPIGGVSYQYYSLYISQEQKYGFFQDLDIKKMFCLANGVDLFGNEAFDFTSINEFRKYFPYAISGEQTYSYNSSSRGWQFGTADINEEPTKYRVPNYDGLYMRYESTSNAYNEDYDSDGIPKMYGEFSFTDNDALQMFVRVKHANGVFGSTNFSDQSSPVNSHGVPADHGSEGIYFDSEKIIPKKSQVQPNTVIKPALVKLEWITRMQCRLFEIQNNLEENSIWDQVKEGILVNNNKEK